MSDIDERDPDQLEAAGEDDSAVAAPTAAPASAPAAPASMPSGPTAPGDGEPVYNIPDAPPAETSMVSEELPPSTDAGSLPVEQHAKVLSAEGQADIKGVEADKERIAKIEKQLGTLQDTRKEAMAWGTVGALQAHAEEQQKQARDMQDELQTQALLYRKAVENFKQLNPNPWSDRGTGYAIGAAISTAIAAFGSGLMGSASNPALQIIEETAHRDLQAQKLAFEQGQQEVENQGTVYAHMRQIYQDKNAATAASWATIKELVASRMQAQLMALSPQERTLQAQKMIAQAHADALTASKKAADLAFTQRVQAQKVKDSELAQSQLSSYRDRLQANRSGGPNLFASQGLKGKQLENSVALYTAYTGPFMENTLEAKEFFKLPLQEQLRPENLNRMKVALANLSQEARKLKGQGQRFSKKLQELDELISSGSDGGAGQKAFADAITSGSFARSFDYANTLMHSEIKRALVVNSGHEPEWWMAKEKAQLDKDNMAMRYSAGVGGMSEQPDTAQ